MTVREGRCRRIDAQILSGDFELLCGMVCESMKKKLTQDVSGHSAR